MKKYRPNQKTLLAVVLSMAAFNASAAWTVNGTFCQSYSDDGQVLLRVKPSTIGINENKPQCGGRGTTELAGSNFRINNTSYPSSVMCNSQSRYQAVQTTVATRDIQSVINALKENKKVNMSTFGSSFTFSTADFASACGSVINQKVADFDPQSEYKRDMAKMGYKQDENGQWHKQSGRHIHAKLTRK
jgi:hypothetical protein